MMSRFTPTSGLIGGSLIGSGAVALLLLNGDVMGASGILSDVLLDPIGAFRDPNRRWKVSFLASFMVAANVHIQFQHDIVEKLMSAAQSEEQIYNPSKAAFIVGGFLVGIGTKLSNGCTSGHGICGLPRFSKRSFVAVMTFMGTGIVTTYVLSPLRSFSHITSFLRNNRNHTTATTSTTMTTVISEKGGLLLSLLVAVPVVFRSLIRNRKKTKAKEKEEDQKSKNENEEEIKKSMLINEQKDLGAALSGVLFAAGLGTSGMIFQTKLIGFLNFEGLWNKATFFDPTLICVMGSGIFCSWIGYQFVPEYSLLFTYDDERLLRGPLLTSSSSSSRDHQFVRFSIPAPSLQKIIRWDLITGASLFGIGWAMAGLCPGPALYSAAIGVVDVFVSWMPAFIVGSYMGGKIKTLSNGTFATYRR